MKPQYFAAVAGTLLVVALILLFAGRSLPGDGQVADSPPRLITALGEGEIQVKPDQVTLTFGVATWTQGASAVEAEALNGASVRRLRETLISAGASEAQIETGRLTVVPLTRQDYAGKTYLAGFAAQNRVTVTLPPGPRVDTLIAAGLANGATSLEETVYRVLDPEAAMQEALGAAIANAGRQAQAIAGSQDRTLGELMSVEVLAEERVEQAPVPGDLLFRVQVRLTYRF